MTPLRDEFDNKYGHPTVDFDFFDFDEGSEVGLVTTGPVSNTAVAGKLAELLIAHASQDDLQFTTEFDDKNQWLTTAGTGGSGMYMPCATQAHQRAVLASHFATYALRHYESCFLGIPDYECLRDLLEDLDAVGLQGQRLTQMKQSWRLVKKCCQEFEERYAQEDPTFLFQYIKTR
jgi:hypothetical protein